jgi:HAE1 family hydrophobic/amphiphilic exporter-1
MMMLALVVFGVLGYSRLGVDQFPSMEFPVVEIWSMLEGASPEVMEEDVTDVIEEYVNTIAGLRSLRSRTSHGISRIEAEFNLDRDIDAASQDVRDKLILARYELPRELDPPVIYKHNPGDYPILWAPLITNRPIVESTEFVKHNVKPYMETISGVGATELFGPRERNIRIWLDGEELSARGLAATDVLMAIRREHVEIPSGRVESRMVEYTVKTDAEFKSVKELERLIITYVEGTPVYLSDVAWVEDGAEDPRTLARYNGKPTVCIGLLKQPGANTVAIADEARQRLARIQETMPAGLSFPTGEGLIDFSLAIRAAVAETEFALLFGALLATVTVFVFLRRTRPTLIVALAIPLSLVATFGVMWILGFTLNVMTLLAMALVVGVVIDDAIVVIENIERRREGGEAPHEAASKGTRQVTLAAIAADSSIVAVFLPVAAVSGIIGNFLKEFGLTVASAVVISLFVALTLTPMLAARMPPPAERAHGSIYHRLELFFAWLDRNYRRMLYWALTHRLATLGVAVLSLVAALYFAWLLPREFFPPEDQGRMLIRVETPPGSSLGATKEIMDMNERWVLQQPELAGLFSAAGGGGESRGGETNRGLMFAVLKSRNQRERTAQELIVATREALAKIPGQRVRVFDLSTMAGSGSFGADFSLDLKGNVSLLDLSTLADKMIRELDEKGGIVDLDKSLKLGLPEVRVLPNREKAAALGVDATSLSMVIQTMIGGMDVATFKEGGRRYDIRARLQGEDRAKPESIEQLYVRASDGKLVELRNLVRIEKGAAPSMSGSAAECLHLREPPREGAGARHRRRSRDRCPDTPRGSDAGLLGRGGRAGQEPLGVRADDPSVGGGHLHAARRAVRELHPSPHGHAGTPTCDGRGARRAARDRNEHQPLQHDRYRAAVRAGDKELDLAGRLRQSAPRGGARQGRSHADSRPDPDAPGADDGHLDDLRRAPRGHRRGTRLGDATAHGDRHGIGHVQLDAPHARRGAGLLPGARRLWRRRLTVRQEIVPARSLATSASTRTAARSLGIQSRPARAQCHKQGTPPPRPQRGPELPRGEAGPRWRYRSPGPRGHARS